MLVQNLERLLAANFTPTSTHSLKRHSQAPTIATQMSFNCAKFVAPQDVLEVMGVWQWVSQSELWSEEECWPVTFTCCDPTKHNTNYMFFIKKKLDKGHLGGPLTSEPSRGHRVTEATSKSFILLAKVRMLNVMDLAIHFILSGPFSWGF